MFNGLNLSGVFLTGLLTGGLTCITIQGGLMTSAILQNPKNKHSKNISAIKGQNLFSVIIFLIARLIAYTILGFALGSAGSLLQISIQTRIVLQLLVVLFMLGTALNLLSVHPVFEIFEINPPRFLVNLAYKSQESKSLFAPLITGLLTVFIPCGATSAMMALSIASGNGVTGAIILATFILGTSPLFFILGFLTLKLGNILKRNFLKFASIALILLALFNFDATLSLANSPVTIRTTLKKVYCVVSYCFDEYYAQPVNEQTITFTNSGYTPSFFAVYKGTKVKLHLVNKNATGCIQAFTMSAFNIQQIVLPGQSADLTFTAPDKPGRIIFTCSSGFYPGTIEVI